MPYKRATVIANLCFIGLAVWFLVMVYLMPQSVIKLTIGPDYFPAILCVMLIVAAVVSTVTTLRGNDDRVIAIPKIKNALIVLGASVLFILAWKYLRQFYLSSFVIMGGLLFLLNPQPNSGKKLLRCAAISLCMQIVVYLVFQRLMHFRF